MGGSDIEKNAIDTKIEIVFLQGRFFPCYVVATGL